MTTHPSTSSPDEHPLPYTSSKKTGFLSCFVPMASRYNTARENLDDDMPVRDVHVRTFTMNIDEPQPTGIVLP